MTDRVEVWGNPKPNRCVPVKTILYIYFPYEGKF